VDGLTDHQVPGLGHVDFKTLARYLPENCIKTLEIGSSATLAQIANGLEVLQNIGIINKLKN
jgi:hypothetical protein